RCRAHRTLHSFPTRRSSDLHCGEAEKVYRLNGKSHRPGLIFCNSCEGSFTVTTGSVMESSHVPLNKWVLAYRLMASSKKGMSAQDRKSTRLNSSHLVISYAV